jgi:hypothetical protein
MMLAFAFFAAVQISPTPAQPPPQHIEFTGTHVVGELVVPEGEHVYGKPHAHKRNLIEMRTSFRPELAKSRDALATAP